MPIKLLIADDHAVVRDGLAAILNLQKDFTVVGQADDGKSALTQTHALKPDVVILDLMMPILNGADATREIRQRIPSAKVLILTTYGSSADLQTALDNGAMGALTKTCPKEELFSAIRHVASGRRFLSDEVRALLKSDTPVETLSPRQEQMLQSIARGFSNQEIAREHGISYGVVKFHLKELFRKLGAANRTEAVAIALRKHLLKI